MSAMPTAFYNGTQEDMPEEQGRQAVKLLWRRRMPGGGVHVDQLQLPVDQRLLVVAAAFDGEPQQLRRLVCHAGVQPCQLLPNTKKSEWGQSIKGSLPCSTLWKE